MLWGQIKEQSGILDREIESEIGDDGIDIKVNVKRRSCKRQSLTKTIQVIQNQPPIRAGDIFFYITKLEDLKQSLSKLDSEIEAYMLSWKLLSDENYSKQAELR